MSDAILRLTSISKQFGAVRAVDDVSLEVKPGEFFALLGPSGCGKTSLMRLIAGFEQADQGRVIIDGQDVSHLPAYRRQVNMMFQSYALFPHMSVERNIAFGLVQDGVSKAEIANRVSAILDLVQLSGLGHRKPQHLSGGQKQRVALARALVKRPRLLLLDEPLAALDRKLREETQFELMRIQRELGTSFMLVTHDQDEAMGMAQRMAVMRAGRIEQIGSPREIYDQPANDFVASFIGKVNFFEAQVSALAAGQSRLRLSTGSEITLPSSDYALGQRLRLALRPEDVQVRPARGAAASGSGPSGFAALVQDSVFLGERQVLRLQLADGALIEAVQISTQGAAYERGMQVEVTLPPDRLRVLPA
ncbi:MAG: ABC transporter ATP-binding protein [Alphaproteobacteria bacterium]|nr:ABC transporter ATP-binding protein [Alphaproteobacteria bacterium]